MSTEREEFEAAMAREGYHSNPQVYRDGTYRDSEYAAGWAMWQAGRAAQAAAVKVPEGFALVPLESTKEMMVAAVKFANGDAVYKNVTAAALEIEESIYGETWAAMVAAATANTQGDKHE